MPETKNPIVPEAEPAPAWQRLAERLRTSTPAQLPEFTRADMIRAFRVGGAEVAADCNADGATATIPWSDEEIAKLLRF